MKRRTAGGFGVPNVGSRGKDTEDKQFLFAKCNSEYVTKYPERETLASCANVGTLKNRWLTFCQFLVSKVIHF